MDVVRYERSDSTARIVLDRPETKNALKLDAVHGLLSAVRRAREDADVRVVILLGKGGDFSAGGDVKEMVARRGQAVQTYERIKSGLTGVLRALRECERPVIAAVDGVCLGAGLGVALACDAILATRRSTFGAPFVKVGLVPDTAVSWMLPRMIGIQQARRLLLTGETIGAEEAARLGLVTRIVDDGPALDAELKSWARNLSALPPTAVRDAKRLLWTSLEQTVETATVQESLAQGLRFTTAEHAAAVDAFVAKKGARK